VQHGPQYCNALMICQYCGEQINNDAEYCRFCGRKVIHVPPVFTMSRIGTDIATEAIRSYTEWGFYYNPDAELDPETGKKPDYGYDALEALPDADHLKWASDFVKAEQMEAILAAEAAAKAEAEKAKASGNGMTQAEMILTRAGGALSDAGTITEPEAETDADDTPHADDPEPTAKPNQKAKDKKKRRVPCAVIIVALVFLAAAIAGGAYFLFGADKTYEVDLNALMVQPKVIGYNDYGEMALLPQIDAAKEDAWLRTVEFDNDKEDFKAVLDTVTYTPDKTEELSNGDTVTITINYDKALAQEKELIVHARPATFEVSGLEKGKDLAYDPDAYHAYYDDFILPESDRTKLSQEDVAFSTNGDIGQVQQAINEIYARHGYIFGDNKYDKLFRSFDWYVPMYKPDKFDNDWLNKNERANLNLLTGYRDDLKAAAEKAAAEKAAAEKAAAEKAAAEKAAKEDSTKKAADSSAQNDEDDDDD